MFFPLPDWGWNPHNDTEWDGLPLSEWLEIRRSCNICPPERRRYLPFTDAEIEAALDGIETNALPFLKMWILAEPDRVKPWINAQLSELNLRRFQFEIDTTRYPTIAGHGFNYYRSKARPLLPFLIELSHLPDPSIRMRAYSFAFFTEPDKDEFLELADRALQDMDAGCDETAASWMVRRFPEEAERRNLRARYPERYIHLDKEKGESP